MKSIACLLSAIVASACFQSAWSQAAWSQLSGDFTHAGVSTTSLGPQTLYVTDIFQAASIDSEDYITPSHPVVGSVPGAKGRDEVIVYSSSGNTTSVDKQFVYAFRKDALEPMWQAGPSSRIFGPAIDSSSDLAIVVNQTDEGSSLVGLNLLSGTQAWSIQMDPRLDVFTLPTVVVVAADVPATLYMSAYNGLNKLEPVTTMAYRLPLQAGAPDLVWQVNISLPESWNVTDTGVGVNVPPTVVTSADLVVQPMHYTGDGKTGSGNYLGAFVALHADTGDVVWTAQAPSGIEVPVALTPAHCPSPANCVEQQLVYAGDRGGTVTTPYLASLNITTGEQLWTKGLKDLTASRAAAYIDPTVPGGRVLVAQGTDDGTVIAVDIATQVPVWEGIIGAGYCSPSIAQLEAGAAPLLYCLDTEYTMHVVNASSGSILQSKDVGPAAGCSVDDHVCVASDGVALSDDQEVHIALGPVLMTLSGIKPSPTPSPAASAAASPASTQGPTPAASPATTQTPPVSPTPAATTSTTPAASYTSVPTGFPSPSPSAGAGSAAHKPSKPSKPSPAGGIAAGVIITLIVLSVIGYLVYWRRGPGKYKSWWALCECRSTKPGSQFKSLSAQGSFATSSGQPPPSSAAASSSAGASRATYSQI